MDSVTPSAPDLDAAVRAAQEEMAKGIALAGLTRDPMRHPLQAISTTLGVMHDVARQVREPIDPQVQVAAVKGIVREAGRGLQEHTAALVSDRQTRTAVWGVGAASLAVCAAALGGYWLGRRDMQTAAHNYIAAQTAKLDRMVSDSPTLPLADAATWSVLIRSNPNIQDALTKGTSRGQDGTGRAFAFVPLWLELPRAPTPAVKR